MPWPSQYQPYPSLSVGDLIKFRFRRTPGPCLELEQQRHTAILLDLPRAPKWGNYPYTFTLLLEGELREVSEEWLDNVERVEHKRGRRRG